MVESILPWSQPQVPLCVYPSVQFEQQPVVVSHSMHPGSQSITGTVVVEGGGVTRVGIAALHQICQGQDRRHLLCHKLRQWGKTHIKHNNVVKFRTHLFI